MLDNPLLLFLSVLASVLPTLAYVLLIWRVDRYEKEPIRLLGIAFVWGALPAVAGSAILELLFDQPLMALSAGVRGLMSMGMVTPVVEEALKGLALLGLFLLVRNEFDGVLDGVIYGSVIGFGFAMTENLLYFLGAWRDGGYGNWGTVVVMRSLVFGLNHAMYTSLTGVGFGLARYARTRSRRLLVLLTGLVAAIVLHAVHNAFLTLESLCLVSVLADWLGVLLVVVVVMLAWRRERRWLETGLAEEAACGLLTPLQLETIVSQRRRIAHEWQLLGIADRRQARLWREMAARATDLAFKKHQLRALGATPATADAIRSLRARIVEIRRAVGDSDVQDLAACECCGRPCRPSAAEGCAHCAISESG